MIRKVFAAAIVLLLGVFTMAFSSSAANAPVDTEEESSPVTTEITVYDEINLFGDSRSTATLSGTTGLDDYDLILLVVEGQTESNYDQDVYNYVVNTLSEEEGFAPEGLDDNSILMTISPDIRKLGIYGGPAVNLTPEDVDYTVNSMVPAAREAEWQRAVYDGFTALDNSMNGTIPAATNNYQAPSHDAEQMMSVLLWVLGGMVGIIILATGGAAVFKSVSKKKADAKNRKIAIDHVNKNNSSYSSFWKGISSMAASTEDKDATVKSKEALEYIRKTREPSASQEEKDNARVWLYNNAEPGDPKNKKMKDDLEYYSRSFGWQDRWSDKVSDANVKVNKAEESLDDFAQVVKNPSDVDKAREAVNEAKASIADIDNKVRSGDMLVRTGEAKLYTETHAFNTTVKDIGQNAEVVPGAAARSLSGRNDGDYNFANSMLLYWGIATIASSNRSSSSSYRSSSSSSSSSSSYPSYTSTSFNSFGGGGFGGGGGGGFKGGSGSF